MESVWFCILVGMLAIYVILDGFDFGAGIVHLFVARGENDKKIVARSIGPFWDGNEVWLIASGGVLFFAFPVLFASAFSGFYLALIIVVWLFILRGVSLELRNHLGNELWKTLWDFLFGVSSLLLSLFFGVALGNVIRGVNLGGVENHQSMYDAIYFFAPLWNSFRPDDNPGLLDWFTLLMGTVSILTLFIHGANWIILKSEGTLADRLRPLIVKASFVLGVLFLLSVVGAYFVRPTLFDRYFDNPLWLAAPLISAASLFGIPFFVRRREELKAFAASCLFIGGSLITTAIGTFPSLLHSVNTVHSDITIYSAANTEYGLSIGAWWWTIAFVLVCSYFFIQHRIFRGKIAGDESIYEDHG